MKLWTIIGVYEKYLELWKQIKFDMSIRGDGYLETEIMKLYKKFFWKILFFFLNYYNKKIKKNC